MDSNRDGRFDTVYHFQEGRLFFYTRDTDGDGKVSIRQTYKHDKPVERKVDEDGDGLAERLIFYNTEGLPGEKSSMVLKKVLSEPLL